MKIHMMKKEEDCEKLEEEVVTLRVKVVKIKKNIEEKGSSTPPVKKFEEKCYRLLERKNEEKVKNYANILKGRNHGQQESKSNEYKRYVSQIIPFIPKHQISFDHCE